MFTNLKDTVKEAFVTFVIGYVVECRPLEVFEISRRLIRRRKLPAVIAMQFSISDQGGLKPAKKLYPVWPYHTGRSGEFIRSEADTNQHYSEGE